MGYVHLRVYLQSVNKTSADHLFYYVCLCVVLCVRLSAVHRRCNNTCAEYGDYEVFILPVSWDLPDTPYPRR